MTLARHLLRALAIAIVIAGVVDPAFTWARSDRPLVAVIDAGDTALTVQVAQRLSRDYDVHRGAIAGAAATALVGRHVPAAALAATGTIVAVEPALRAPRVEIERAEAPRTASASSRIPVDVTLHAVGARGKTLRVDVLAGSILLDRVTPAIASDDERVSVSLSAAALTAGLARMVIKVRDNVSDDASLTTEAAVATEVRTEQWRVWFADVRPSWTSTFVRRAIETDRRFVVSTRVQTSKGIAVESGGAPKAIDAASLMPFDAVVIGAPDALTPNEVSALEQFARRRGGSVVLLMDSLEQGAFARLTGVSSWRDAHSVERRVLPSAAGNLVATELAEAVGTAAGFESLASVKDAKPAVWQVPLGAGRVIVNGALDAWRYRTREQGGFSRFWISTLATVAASAPSALSITVIDNVVRAGESIDVTAVVRDVQLSDASRPASAVSVRARAAAVGESGDGEPVRLWPTPERGVFAGTVPAPHTPGPYRIVVDAQSETGAALGTGSIDVLAGEPLALSSQRDLAAWTTAHGGVVVSASSSSAVTDALATRIAREAQPTRMHPMRSVWWLPLMTLVLGAEWWLRRRTGER